MIEFVYLELKNKVDIHEARKFKRTIYDLKTYREESDYEDMEVGVIKSNKAYKYAEELISYLKSTFNV